MRRAALATLLSATLAASGVRAECTADAMIVLDASASMTSPGAPGSTVQRIHEARRAVAEVMPRVEHVRRIGLVTYGPGGAGACDGVTLHLPPRAGAAEAVIAAVDATAPGGLTPLTAAVRAAAASLGADGVPGIVVLVTDGNESCGGAPCRLAQRLAADPTGPIVHVIGFKAAWDTFARGGEDQRAGGFAGEIVADCLSEATGGLFVSTQALDELIAALMRTLGCQAVAGLRPGAGGRIPMP